VDLVDVVGGDFVAAVDGLIRAEHVELVRRLVVGEVAHLG
jgi:hypothetical protein